MPESFDPDLDLVVVLETSDRILLAFAKGLLEEAGIPFYVLGQIATLIQDVDGFLHKWVRHSGAAGPGGRGEGVD